MTVSGSARRNLVRLVLVALGCRVLIPVGYMPAPLSEGGPIVLCPSGLSIGIFSLPADRHAGHEGLVETGSSTEIDAWEFCSFGTASGALAMGKDVDIRSLPFEHSAPGEQPQSIVELLLPTPYQARAPPLFPSIEA